MADRSKIDTKLAKLQEMLALMDEPTLAEFQERLDISWVFHDSSLEGVVLTYHEIKSAIDREVVSDVSLVPTYDEIRAHKAAIDWVREQAAKGKKQPITLELLLKLRDVLNPEPPPPPPPPPLSATPPVMMPIPVLAPPTISAMAPNPMMAPPSAGAPATTGTLLSPVAAIGATANSISSLPPTAGFVGSLDGPPGSGAIASPDAPKLSARETKEAAKAAAAAADPTPYRRDTPVHRLYFHDIPAADKIAGEMKKLGEWLQEPETKKMSALRLASKLHFKLMQIYPFPKNSGKHARLAMNLVLLRAGFPPAIIHSTERRRYYEALRGPSLAVHNIMAESLENGIDSAIKLFTENKSGRRALT